MFEPNEAFQKNERLLPSAPQPRTFEERKQRRMMVIALALLLVALGFALYRDRDFWFPETQEAEDESQPQQVPPAVTNPTQTVVSRAASPVRKKSHASKTQVKSSAPLQSAEPESSAPPITATATRTVLPPLEVEVVAGDVHRSLRPGTNSVRVDLQPGMAPQAVAVPPSPSGIADSAAGVTSKAAERLQMSADTAEVVNRPVKPDYPLLARQMKVQGSVILQALIGRDGLIQGLQVVSGPPILASAAQEAVKQWHFKPHYQGSESVETQARITVNFTISTN
jgi:protein TonB